MSLVARSVQATSRRDGALWTRLGDYIQLSKPRIVALELVIAAMAACIASPHDLDGATLLVALSGTALVAASASAANQLLECAVDARMPRTAHRPLAAGRVTRAEAVALSALGLAIGEVWLARHVNLLTAALGLASWTLYVAVYTPLKSRTPFNTMVGALAGAIPMLMGWAATGQPLNLTAWALCGVLYLWQFPHFMAIAWLYRHDYALAGHKMLTTVDPSGARAGALAVRGAAALAPVSLIPAIVPSSGSPWIYALWALGLAGAMAVRAIHFALAPDAATARSLLRASLIYLPAWMSALLLVSL